MDDHEQPCATVTSNDEDGAGRGRMGRGAMRSYEFVQYHIPYSIQRVASNACGCIPYAKRHSP
eukprot:9281705-Lingulodinium_polyedra.AAC.1